MTACGPGPALSLRQGYALHVCLGLVCLSPVYLSMVGCVAPRKGQDAGRTGTVEEIGRRMREGGVEPVRGALDEGDVPPEVDEYALADPETLPDAEPQEEEEAAEEELDEPETYVEDPYLRFGERIILREEGGEFFITKPYSMPPGRAQKLVELMAALEPFPFRPRPEADKETGLSPLDRNYLEYQVLPSWDQEFYAKFSDPAAVPAAANPIALSDIFVVTATYSRLEAFEEFLDLFAGAGVPQIELEAKIIEIVETSSLDIGINSLVEFGARNFVQSLAFNLPNVGSGSEGIIELGAVQDDTVFDAVIEVIQTWDNVQIDSKPRIAVRAGGVASIDSTTDFPFFEIKSLTPDGNFTTSTQYKKVGTQLYISPRLIGTKTLALDVHLIGSQQVGSQATASAGNVTIEVPIIAYRTAKTVVYLEPGQTLVIGGLTQEREQELVSKIPILGDIPLIKHFFRSTFTQRERQTVLFAISPRIIQRSDLETEF